MAKSASDLFKSISAKLKDSISSDLVVVSTSLYARSLITTQLHEEMLEGLDSNSNKAAKLVDVLQKTLDAHTNPEAYLQEVCSALKDVGQKQIVDVVHELEPTLSISMVQLNDSSSASIPTDEHKETPVTDRVQRIKKWLEEGEVELEITRINMHGAPGAGKTCSLHLLLNEPPPPPSTVVACPAVQATRISIDGENKWERVDIEDLLNQLASTAVDDATDDRSISAYSDKLSQEEPSKNEPTDSEVVKKILHAYKTGKSKKLSRNWVYFIDSGGQPAYQELLPLFTRAAALNIITIDLTKGLDKKCQFQYRIDQFEYPININQTYSNRDIIQSTVSSGAMFNPIEIPYLSESDKKKNIPPCYFVLGTRKDKLEENGTLDELNKMNKVLLEEYKANIKVIRNRQDHDNILYPVNTMLEGPEREEASVALCTKISSFGAAMTIRIPIRLFVFEISLQREAKNKNRSFLTREEVKEIGKSLRLDDESDIDDALRYLHNVTIILYYPAVLPNIIFVDPKPILDVLSLLIASTYTNRIETDNLRKLGLFNEDLLQLFGKKIFEHADFTSSHMIKLLKHLHIIAKVENREEGDYFFPCALPSYDKLNPPPTEIQPLLIAWEIKERDETTLAIPQGLFPLTIVHLLEKKDNIGFSPVDKEYYRCNSAMSLCVFEEYHIDIINRYTHLEIRVHDDCRDICPQIRELVSEAVVDSCKDLKLKNNNKFVFAFKCPPRNTCIVKEDKCSTWCTECLVQCKVLQGDDDSYRCWFSDCQSSSPAKQLEGDEVELKDTDINMHGAPGATATATDKIDIEKLENWLKEGKVVLEITRINMHGLPGAGKTCSQRLLLNEPPPGKLTDSTPIACRAVQATRISIDDKSKKWKRVEIEDLLKELASHLKKKMKDEEISTEVDKAPKPKIDAPNHSDELPLAKPIKNEPAPTKNEPVLTKNEPVSTENQLVSTKNEPAPAENELAPAENEEAKNKPTENAESTKINQDTDMKVIKEIADSLADRKFQELSTNWVYFIDSGGQPAYRELLPLFTRAAALNIITIDLTKGLDKNCEFQYRISQNMFPIKTKLEYSNLDIIQSTISSEAMLNPIEIPYVSESDMPKHPHYLILGTRIDELKKEGMLNRLDNMNKKLINEGFNNLIKRNEGKGSVIFPVNTLLLAGSKEREKASEELCTEVSNCRVAIKIELPIRLFTFEIALQMEAKKKQRSFLTIKEVMEIGKPLELNKSDIDNALKFLHNVTIILYYPAVLPNIIFVDPEPILDVLSRLIAIRYVDLKDQKLIADPPPRHDDTKDLINHGLFKEDLLKIIGKQKIFNNDFESSHMIDLLKHLHIIAEVKEKKNWCHVIKLLFLRLLQSITKVENKEEKKNNYFFPCALPSCDKLDDPPTEIQPLLIAWKINKTTPAIPQGLFPLTIVHLLEKKDKVDFSSKELDSCYRYNNAMTLCVFEKYHIDIINRYTHLEIRVRGRCRNNCPQIRKLVSEAVEDSSKDLKLKEDNKFVFAFKCPLQKTCIVKEDKCSTLCTHCVDQCDVLKGDDDSYKCWFRDHQIQSSCPDTVQVSTPPHAVPNKGISSKEVYQPDDSQNPGKNWGCYIMFMIFLAVGAVLAGVAISHFVTLEKNTNDVEKFLTIMTHIATTGALPVQPHQDSTTVNPYSDGAGQLGIEDADKVLMVLNKAQFAPTKWDDLGLKLGLLMTRLNVIAESGDSFKHLKKTIEAWLMGADNVKSRTWWTLIDAVREAGDRAAAERIPEKLKSLYNITL